MASARQFYYIPHINIFLRVTACLLCVLLQIVTIILTPSLLSWTYFPGRPLPSTVYCAHTLWNSYPLHPSFPGRPFQPQLRRHITTMTAIGDDEYPAFLVEVPIGTIGISQDGWGAYFDRYHMTIMGQPSTLRTRMYLTSPTQKKAEDSSIFGSAVLWAH
ncbi:hypothetical protein BGW36DRAFT_42277 [Talaromyces proteolyticus]|uniref:Uncharacterized protein n=1 Tax=Talaromyces proteolyticus TaxID=1131652 RepID=A0AAD4KGY5_9EURO|nr:uncharacterized protein BGW36DRAFT_42277 [Talaromyces proteolyticus]KAH8692133.1 hypothetical protein BGW36DRAFT_42277 [Talaromyces proteolyticus]